MSSMLDSRDLTSIRELVSLFSDLPDSQVKGALCLWKNASYRCSLRRNYNVVRAGMPSLNQKCASPGVFFLRSERKYLLPLIVNVLLAFG
jgi:hypothetical protein